MAYTQDDKKKKGKKNSVKKAGGLSYLLGRISKGALKKDPYSKAPTAPIMDSKKKKTKK